jgi:hypothetical protein
MKGTGSLSLSSIALPGVETFGLILFEKVWKKKKK